jgi:DNA polymerase eta
MLLAAAAAIVSRARAAVTRELGFTCSAGIAANKLLAKLCGGLHKPNQQTILPASAVTALLDPLPIDRLRGFGGKLGSLLREGRSDLGLPGFSSAGELRRAGVGAAARLLRGEWAHPDDAAATAVRMASGLDDDAVRKRPLAKQVGASKQFSGSRGSARGPLDTRAVLERWLLELAQDISERLEQQVSGTWLGSLCGWG